MLIGITTQHSERWMHRHGKYSLEHLTQARCDEKGFLAVCAFGLPGSLWEDGPERAVGAALAIVRSLQVRHLLPQSAQPPPPPPFPTSSPRSKARWQRYVTCGLAKTKR